MNYKERYEGVAFPTSHGDIEIIEYVNSRNVKARFVDTGCVISTTSGNIFKGKVKDRLKVTAFGVGFIGIGRHNTTEGRKRTRVYSTWVSMMQRCYSEKFRCNYKWYSDCTVCEEWHNFQNFAEWVSKQEVKLKENYEIDKDVKVHGNRVYSPEACMIVHKEINYLFIAGKKENGLPVGITFIDRANGYKVSCYYDGKVNSRFKKSIDEASIFYVREKTKAVKMAYEKHYPGNQEMKDVLISKLKSFLEEYGHEKTSHLVEEW